MFLEIRAHEGGDDAKLFMNDLAKTYMKFLEKSGWLISSKQSESLVIIEYKDTDKLVKEAGIHRVQRVPPTEKRGRVHTSSVTISVIDNLDCRSKFHEIKDDDFEYRLFSGTGKGGQHRNRHQNSVVMTHIPSGIKQTVVGRSEEQNLKTAKEQLLVKLQEQQSIIENNTVNDLRNDQIKPDNPHIRTYRFQDDQVVNHLNGKTTSCKNWMKGNLEKLW